MRRKLNGRKVISPNSIDDIPDSPGNEYKADQVKVNGSGGMDEMNGLYKWDGKHEA